MLVGQTFSIMKFVCPYMGMISCKGVILYGVRRKTNYFAERKGINHPMQSRTDYSYYTFHFECTLAISESTTEDEGQLS
jgi:hypothetical protein